MGRPPLQGQPAFRFLPREIADMEKILEEHNGSNPQREVIYSLAEKFSTSSERAGKIVVQWKQIWNWFQNRRHAQRSKTAKVTSKPNSIPSSSDESTVKGTPSVTSVAISEKIDQDTEIMDFEARSARDQAWYDVAGFLTFRCLQPEDPEVLVRFAGFGPEEDEWVNVKRSVRRRSLPCEVTECVAVLPGDLILCFQEGKEQALYYDAHILDVQRNRHDIRGCRCRFLVRYDHDNSEEIVPLRKVCRRPETDMRLKKLQDPKMSSPSRCMTQDAKDVKDATNPVGVNNTESGAGILSCMDSAIPSSTPKTSSVIAFPSSEKAYNSTMNPQSNPNILVSLTEKDDSQPNKVASQGDLTAAET